MIAHLDNGFIIDIRCHSSDPHPTVSLLVDKYCENTSFILSGQTTKVCRILWIRSLQ